MGRLHSLSPPTYIYIWESKLTIISKLEIKIESFFTNYIQLCNIFTLFNNIKFIKL